MNRWLRALVIVAVAGVTLPELSSDARPGGGHTSSGRSSGGGGGGGHFGGGGRSGGSRGGGCDFDSGGSGSCSSFDGVSAIILAAIVFMFLVGAVVAATQRGQTWSSAPIAPDRRAVRVGELLQRDPDFSRAVFEDLAFELYAAAHRTRGDPAQPLAAYISPTAAAQLAARGEAPEQIVIGSLRIDNVQLVAHPEPHDQIVVRVEATHLRGNNGVQVVEYLQFGRAGTAKSKPPARARTWPCPNCGAPWSGGLERVCTHCGENVGAGRFDWILEQMWVESWTTALASLTGTVAEYGNDLPTVRDPAAVPVLAAITQDDPEVRFETLIPRIRLTYDRLNQAWNGNDLGPARGFVTAALCGYLEYWLREYARQNLRNRLEDATVHDIQLAKVVRDRYFHAITVRVFADGRDFTVDGNGHVVGGSQTDRRAYTEYWTFLRSSGRRGPVVARPDCPNCGAPLAISDVGDCTHCMAAVESGNFDWILSKIEQDDWYAG